MLGLHVGRLATCETSEKLNKASLAWRLGFSDRKDRFWRHLNANDFVFRSPSGVLESRTGAAVVSPLTDINATTEHTVKTRDALVVIRWPSKIRIARVNRRTARHLARRQPSYRSTSY